ncbi:diacylglycerol kinase 7-like isoform X1 [Primulina eburnea]|uniref:diacylglycerol kinase 7-like isoform X1 n=1 Tax=Primulina eburnea TaxID=1245227 RepID=UPI003C6C110F
MVLLVGSLAVLERRQTLGTGNDLSRSFNWLACFNFNASKEGFGHTLFPKSHKRTPLDQELQVEEELPERVSSYQGVFYNYFSLGMDAQVAYGFLRNEKPYLAQGPISNKLIYSGYSCKQGWFFTPCSSDPGLRLDFNVLRIYVKKVNCSEWEQIPVPSSVRSVVVLNLPSYESGRNPWGNLKPEYLEKRSVC